MRINYDIDRAAFAKYAALTLGQIKDLLLSSKAEMPRRVGAAITGVMVAAVAKLMDVHDLVLAATKLKRGTRARTLVGGRRMLSSRLQPNHPTDDLDAMTLLV